jgi:hypothetical protein
MGIFSTWAFWRTPPAIAPLSGPVRRRLAADRSLGDEAAGAMRMLTRRGSYADRKVTYFRVIDPAAVARSGVEVRRFADLDAHRALQLHDGHIERDGNIVLNRQPASPGGAGS